MFLVKMHIYQISTDYRGTLAYGKPHQFAASMLTFLPSPSAHLPNFFPWETYSTTALERTRNENSEYDWYRSIDFLLQMYLITWLQKSLNQPLFSVRQYKVKSILQIKYLKIWQKY